MAIIIKESNYNPYNFDVYLTKNYTIEDIKVLWGFAQLAGYSPLVFGYHNYKETWGDIWRSLLYWTDTNSTLWIGKELIDECVKQNLIEVIRK